MAKLSLYNSPVKTKHEENISGTSMVFWGHNFLCVKIPQFPGFECCLPAGFLPEAVHTHTTV